MIVVDSSIWISYFSEPNKESERFADILDSGQDIAIISIILSEVLSGFRKDSDYKNALKVMAQVALLPENRETYIEASNLYRNLRKRGVTVRGIVDCLIAQVCIDTGGELLTLDRDFKKIAAHSRLKLFE